MTKAVLLAVDDDPAVARAVERDLRRRYGERYRVLRADSGAAALELVEQTSSAAASPSRCWSPTSACREMTGVEFLARAIEVAPRRQARAADRLRRHRRGDPGDQRGRASTTT